MLLDPYAKLVKGRRFFGDSSQKFAKFYGTYDFESSPFNWGDEYGIPNIAEVQISFSPSASCCTILLMSYFSGSD